MMLSVVVSMVSLVDRLNGVSLAIRIFVLVEDLLISSAHLMHQIGNRLGVLLK